MAEIIRQPERYTRENKAARSAFPHFDAAKYPPIEITRIFLAPVARVWNAWSKPELVKQWWGPEGFSCPEAQIDFRPGGRYLFAMKEEATGKITWSGGTYHELVTNEGIACTDSFTDEHGNTVPPSSYGMPGEWPEILLITIEFEERGAGQTRMHLKHEGIPKDMHDDCVQGWSSSLDKFERLVQLN